MYQACAVEAIDQDDDSQKIGDGDASSPASLRTRHIPDVVETGVMAGYSYVLFHAVVPRLEMVLAGTVRDKQQCHVGFL